MITNSTSVKKSSKEAIELGRLVGWCGPAANRSAQKAAPRNIADHPTQSGKDAAGPADQSRERIAKNMT
ncbi:MAG: hypothetical protein AB8B60_03330 [Sulfitobacter sp.]